MRIKSFQELCYSTQEERKEYAKLFANALTKKLIKQVNNMKKPFEANKTAKELGIDTSRIFELVAPDEISLGWGLKKGDLFKCFGDEKSISPDFKRIENSNEKTLAVLAKYNILKVNIYWSELAYADDPKPSFSKEGLKND
jgi:hypothetical protein